MTYSGKGTLFAPPQAVLSAAEARERRERRWRRRWEQHAAAAEGRRENGENGEFEKEKIENGSGGGIPVDESLVLQADPFDFLFLKGKASAAAVRGAEEGVAAATAAAASSSPLRPWLFGRSNNEPQASSLPPPRLSSPPSRSLLAIGAVHRSPAEASEEAPRLVLTVDDACECCGGG